MPLPIPTDASVPRGRAAASLGRALVLVVLAALLSSCSQDSASTTTGSSTTAPVPSTTSTPVRSPGCDSDTGSVGPRAVHERVDVRSSGVDRWYQRFVPTSYDGSPMPLVIDLHGYLSGAAIQTSLSDMGSLADTAGFVVATPQGNSEQVYWNAAPVPTLPDDVAFIADLIDQVETDLCIDPARVYVDGLSNGAFLASLLACRLPDRIAAVAAVAGLVLPADCHPSRPVPVLAIHGTDDPFVSFDGGRGPALAGLEWNPDSQAAFDALPFESVLDSAAGWAGLDGCEPTPSKDAVSSVVERFHYEGCKGGADVVVYVVDGGGHTWPGSAFSHASESILGPTTDDIDASEVIWSFFADHPLANPAPARLPVVPTAVQKLDVTGTEYAFKVDDGGQPLHAGWTEVTFHNSGVEAHQVMFASPKEGVDLADLAATAGDDSSGSKAIEYVDMLGGVSYIGPGRTIKALVNLPEGIVVAMCYVPDAHGVAHALMGMSTILTVGPADATPADGPSTERVQGVITMTPKGYRLPEKMAGGWYRVVNEDGGTKTGDGLHEMAIMRLDRKLDDKGIDRLLGALASNATPEVSLVALGGMGALSAGFDGYLYLDLQPGHYLAVDFMPDPGSPRPHLLDGYMTPFEL